MKKAIRNKSVQDGLCVLALSLALGIYSAVKFIEVSKKTAWIMSPYLFPIILAGMGLILAVSILSAGLQQARAEAGEAGRPIKAGRVALTVLICVGYDLLMQWVSFIPATAVFLAAMTCFLGERRWKVVVAVAVLTPLALYAIFHYGLNVRLP